MMGCTFAWAAPEFVIGSWDGPGRRSTSHICTCALDIWSVGCLLAFVMTGKNWWLSEHPDISPIDLHAQWVSLKQSWDELYVSIQLNSTHVTAQVHSLSGASDFVTL